MVERWMKERASKSYGGQCMSKFVQENEKKRIQRLKNIRSSLPNNGVVPRRIASAREGSGIKTARKIHNGEFQLRNLCATSVKTKSGLKLRVSDCEATSPAVSSATKHAILTSKRSKRAGSTEGKENWSPGDSALAIKMFRKKKAVQENIDTNLHRRSKTLNSDQAVVVPQNQNCGYVKAPDQKFGKESSQAPNLKNAEQSRVTCNNRGMGSEKSTHSRGSRSSTSALRGGVKSRKSYINRSVTVGSLLKERNDAMKILKEIDETNLIGKMTDMQIAMDMLGEHQRHDNRQNSNKLNGSTSSVQSPLNPNQNLDCSNSEQSYFVQEDNDEDHKNGYYSDSFDEDSDSMSDLSKDDSRS